MKKRVWVGLLVVLCCSCKKEEQHSIFSTQQAPQEQNIVLQDVQAGSGIKPSEGLQLESASPSGRVPSICPEGKVITSGNTTTPWGVVYLAYQAALKGDNPDAFEDFYSLFLDGTNRDFVKTQHWPRIIQHVRKYVSDDGSFVVCRTVKVADNRLKLFIRCNDPKKSDPPIVLENVNGTWKIEFFTP